MRVEHSSALPPDIKGLRQQSGNEIFHVVNQFIASDPQSKVELGKLNNEQYSLIRRFIRDSVLIEMFGRLKSEMPILPRYDRKNPGNERDPLKEKWERELRISGMTDPSERQALLSLIDSTAKRVHEAHAKPVDKWRDLERRKTD